MSICDYEPVTDVQYCQKNVDDVAMSDDGHHSLGKTYN